MQVARHTLWAGVNRRHCVINHFVVSVGFTLEHRVVFRVVSIGFTLEFILSFWCGQSQVARLLGGPLDQQPAVMRPNFVFRLVRVHALW